MGMKIPKPAKPKTFTFDLETTGVSQAFGPRRHRDVGISQLAMREVGAATGYSAFTDILMPQVKSFDAGKITAAEYIEQLSTTGPTGVRWQKGFNNPHNVLFGVHQRHLEATRAAIAGRGDVLVKESALIERMTKTLEAGHKLQAWNINFDLLLTSQVSARTNPALLQRWYRALNVARNRGMLEDMATGTKKFMYLAAQESFMRGKTNRKEFFTLGQISPDIRRQIREGKLNLDEIERLSYDKMMEPHQGFKEFFTRRAERKGDPTLPFKRYQARLNKYGPMAIEGKTFASGYRFPDIYYTKGWSTGIITEMLAPGGIKGSTLEKEALKVIHAGSMTTHEAMSDTVLEEVFQRIFKTKAGTWAGSWKDIGPRFEKYGIHSQEHLFQRHRAAVEVAGRSQLSEIAREATHNLGRTFEDNVLRRGKAVGSAARDIASAAGQQPETLRTIYSKAYRQVAVGLKQFTKTHPKISIAAGILAGLTIGEALSPNRERSEYDSIMAGARKDALYTGPMGHGSMKALTDYGSARAPWNPATTLFSRMVSGSALRRVIGTGGVEMTRVAGAMEKATYGMGRYHGTYGRIPLNRGAWSHLLDLPRKSPPLADVYLPRKMTSVRTMPLIHPPVDRLTAPLGETVAGRHVEEGFDRLLERQQSLRMVIDPHGTGGSIGPVPGRPWPVGRDKAWSLYRNAEAEVAAMPKEPSMVRRSIGQVGMANVRMPKPPMAPGKVSPALPERFPKQAPLVGYQGANAAHLQVMEAVNRAGYKPGIRDSMTPWNIAGYGIQPSTLPMGNVSSFHHGRPTFSAGAVNAGMHRTRAPNFPVRAPRRELPWTRLAGPGLRQPQALVHGPESGQALANLAGSSSGSWAFIKKYEVEASMSSMAARPGEFQAMRPFGDFPASYKAGAVAEFEDAGDASGHSAKAQLLVLGGVTLFPLHQVPEFGINEAWEYFYNAKPDKVSGVAMNKAKGAIRKALKKEGYTKAEMVQWMKDQKWLKGFTCKIKKDLSKKNWVEKVSSRWEGIRNFPERLHKMLKGKKSQLGKEAAAKATSWFQDLALKPVARSYGMTVENYVAAKKTGKILQKNLKFNIVHQKIDAAKYLYKHLIEQPTGFQGKLAGVMYMLKNNKSLELMKVAHSADLLSMIPDDVKKARNIFTSAGSKLAKYTEKSTFFAKHSPQLSKALLSAGKGVERFGRGLGGKIVGRLPLVNMAFGVLDGYSLMDQYENATTGFITETAASTVSMSIQVAMFRPAVWMSAAGYGGTIGAALGPVGAVAGAIIGFVGALATSLIGGMILGEAAGAATRWAVGGALGARKKRTIDPAAYLPPDAMYPPQGFTATKMGGPSTFQRFHGIDSPRRDLTPFGGAYNPLRGMDIDSRTLSIANKRERITMKPRAARPISSFTPTFGLVNRVLWSNRHNSVVRSTVQRRRPVRDRNPSRMSARAA